MKLALAEVYEVATFYAHFDVVKEGEAPPPPVTVRVCDSLVLRDAGRGTPAARSSRQARPRRPRRARAVHGRLRPRAGLRGRPCAGVQRHAGQGRVRREGAAASACLCDAERSRTLPQGRRLCAARRLPRRQAHARRPDQDRQRRRPARPRRRRISDRPQMVAGARRAGAADVRRQLRRRRARHVQGPPLPRAGPASLHRRHADRRLGGRGARHLHLCARRISRSAAPARRGIREGRARPGSPRTRGCICAAAPAPISAAKSPR